VSALATPELVVNAQQGTVRWNGAVVEFTDMERRLLVMLARDSERLCSPRELVAALWPSGLVPRTPLGTDPDTTRPLRTLVKRIRDQLGGRRGGFIVNTWGQGYRLVAPGQSHRVAFVEAPSELGEIAAAVDDAMHAMSVLGAALVSLGHELQRTARREQERTLASRLSLRRVA